MLSILNFCSNDFYDFRSNNRSVKCIIITIIIVDIIIIIIVIINVYTVTMQIEYKIFVMQRAWPKDVPLRL
jgi:uncharacterized integral membrane protein